MSVHDVFKCRLVIKNKIEHLSQVLMGFYVSWGNQQCPWECGATTTHLIRPFIRIVILISIRRTGKIT